jgi:hypothetical protein
MGGELSVPVKAKWLDGIYKLSPIDMDIAWIFSNKESSQSYLVHLRCSVDCFSVISTHH